MYHLMGNQKKIFKIRLFKIITLYPTYHKYDIQLNLPFHYIPFLVFYKAFPTKCTIICSVLFVIAVVCFVLDSQNSPAPSPIP